MGAEGFLTEAATHKSAIQRLLRQAESILTDKRLPTAAKAEVRKLRDQLRKRWSQLSDSGAEAKTAAATESADLDGGELDRLTEALSDPAIDNEVRGIVGAFATDLTEALKDSDSYARRRMLVNRALERLYRTSDFYVRDVFDADAIVQRGGDLFRHAYTIAGTPPEATVEQGVPVEVVYNDLTPPTAAAPVSEGASGLVGGGVTPVSPFGSGDVNGAPLSFTQEPEDLIEVANDPEPDNAAPETQLTESGALLAESGAPLTEASLGSGGTALLKILAPGWGASGYYSPAVIKRDGPKVFREGTQSFWDHAPDGSRPERSLRDLAGVLTETAQWREDGPEGPGLYGKVKVFSAFRKPLRELASYIGASIEAFGETSRGKAEGRVGRIVDSIRAAKSIDFVTRAGAGGKVVQLFESAKPAGEAGLSHLMEVVQMGDNKEGAALTEALGTINGELERLRSDGLRRDARDFVSAQLRETRLPQAAQVRLLERLTANPPAEGGALDVEKLSEALKTEVSAELTYLSEATGGKFGVTGLGLSTAAPAGTENSGGAAPAPHTAALTEAMSAFGLSESETKAALSAR